jgi:hypothetical protein
MKKRSLWRPDTEYRQGQVAIITWEPVKGLLTCEQPGKTGAIAPQRPKGSETYRPKINDGSVEWSYTVIQTRLN